MTAKPRLPLGDSALLAFLTFGAAAVAALGAAILVAVGAVAIAAAQGATTGEELEAAAATYWAMLATIVVSQLAMAVVIFAAWWCTGAPFRERLGFTAPRVSVRDAIIILLAGGVPFALSIGAASLLPAMGGADSVQEVWEISSIAQAALWVGVIGILPGVIEEVLFRGLIQRGLMRRMSPLLAILLTSVLFALLHIDPPAMGLAFTLGLWLGVVAWRTGSIVLTVLTHVIVNAGWNVAMFLAHQGDIAENTWLVALSVLGVVALAAFVWSIPILVRAGRSTTSPTGLDLDACHASAA